jgi:hypothetical protein
MSNAGYGTAAIAPTVLGIGALPLAGYGIGKAFENSKNKYLKRVLGNPTLNTAAGTAASLASLVVPGTVLASQAVAPALAIGASGAALHNLGLLSEWAWGRKANWTATKVAHGAVSIPSLVLRGLEGLHNLTWQWKKEDVAKKHIRMRLLHGAAAPITVPSGIFWNRLGGKQAAGFIYKEGIRGAAEILPSFRGAIDDNYKSQSTLGKVIQWSASRPRKIFHYLLDKQDGGTKVAPEGA